VPAEPAVFAPIGIVRNSVLEPRMDGWESVRSDIIVREELIDALDGIDAYSHVIVLFWIDRVPEGERTLGRIHPRGDPQYPLQGVLATRSQRRPNPIGLTVVPLLRRRRNVLRVRSLDAINGTPVLDIKPYIPFYDALPDAAVPDWTKR
jgi:tRNA-Thr(GGU) m(6)t(6)A37 methyltransferase TsaA